MELEFARQAVIDIQREIEKMSKEDIAQALEIVRVSLLADVEANWVEPPDEEKKD